MSDNLARYKTVSETYRKGLTDEQRILDWLTNCGDFQQVEKSSKEDDVINDIDAYVWKNGKRFTVSIKSQQRAVSTGNLCFELQVLDRDSLLWEPSWYHKDKALYVVLVGTSIYYLRPSKLHGFINSNGWSKVVTLNSTTKQSQRNMNHKHINAKLGIVSMQTLIDANVLQYKGELQ
ncbi:hypothetical protein BLD44_028480 [Mastigocladus laminosus UU774]|nr:hypothetical protein BLD44_028480 [Mastigocladus laminosus UU774]